MNEISLTRFKRCTKCRMWWPATLEFFKNAKRYRYGISAACKICLSQDERLWREKNKGYISSQQRAWREANKERIAAARKAYYQKNAVEIRQKVRMWEKANPQRVRKQGHKRRALERGAEHEPYTRADINTLWHDQDGLCAYCRSPMFGVYHIDHVMPISRGGADKLENLALACPSCNSQKYNKTGEEYMKQNARKILLGGKN